MSGKSLINPWTCRNCYKKIVSSSVQRRFLHDRFVQRHIEDQWAWAERAAEVKDGKRKSMLSVLEERGLVHQIAGSRDQLDNLMTSKRIGAYVGVDPTAASLHVGHVIPMMALFWLYLNGFQAVSLIGGATAQIGDPTGRTTERAQMNPIDRKANMTHMHMQLKSIWEHVEELGRKYGHHRHRSWQRHLLNNNVWLNKVTVTEVLKLMGSGLRMSSLLSRDSVRMRLDSKDGMSLSEFCYPVFQAWDWWHMYQSLGIQVQIGGADQFGNIITGMEAVKHVATSHPHQDWRVEEDEKDWEPTGFTVPLLTNSAGEKFGKSAGNAIWLNHEMTSPFDLYAYMLGTPDADVERYLKMFTFMPVETIAELMTEHQKSPEKRAAQHALASDFVQLAHGGSVAEQTREEHSARASQRRVINIRQHLEKAKAEADAATYSRKLQQDPAAINMSLNRNAPIANANNSPAETMTLSREFLEDNTFPAVLHALGMVSSRSEAQRLISNKGAYVAGLSAKKAGAFDDFGDDLTWRPIISLTKGVPATHVVWDEEKTRGLLVLRIGKWKVKIIRVHPENSPLLESPIQDGTMLGEPSQSETSETLQSQPKDAASVN